MARRTQVNVPFVGWLVGTIVYDSQGCPRFIATYTFAPFARNTRVQTPVLKAAATVDSILRVIVRCHLHEVSTYRTYHVNIVVELEHRAQEVYFGQFGRGTR
jgi:hypothetical protein